jgi:hypothetical protein
MHQLPKERALPRISVHKLGTYLEAGPFDREKILRDQKYPADFQRLRYRDAEDEIRRALFSSDVKAGLVDGGKRISAKTVGTKWAQQAQEGCLLAVEKFSDLFDSLDLDDVSFVRVGRSTLPQRIEGVSISTRPLALIRRQTRKGERFGAILFVMRKEEKLTPKGGKAIAELLRRALSVNGIYKPDQIDPKLCVVVDIFHNAVFEAPPRSKRVIEEIRAACREIVARWPFIAAVRVA